MQMTALERLHYRLNTIGKIVPYQYNSLLTTQTTLELSVMTLVVPTAKALIR